MPLWSVQEWRARIGNSWCALGRPIRSKSSQYCSTGNYPGSPPPGGGLGRRAESHADHGVVTVVIMISLLIGAILTLSHFILAGDRLIVGCWFVCTPVDLLLVQWILAMSMVSNDISRFFSKSWSLLCCSDSTGSFLSGLEAFPSSANIHGQYCKVTISCVYYYMEKCKRTDEQYVCGILLRNFWQNFCGKMRSIKLYLASAMVKASLLLRCGDVEMNPGPLDKLDQVIPSKDLGPIADAMYEWEGPIFIAKLLGLIMFDIDVIVGQYPANPELQMRSALEKWKQKNGANATYGNLCAVFERADYRSLSDRVRKICPDISVADTHGATATQILQVQGEDALLTLENMREILELTWPHRASWKLIGMELGIDIDTLDAIEVNYRNDQDRLRELISTLLRHPYLRLTRATITAVLKSDYILPTADQVILSKDLGLIADAVYEWEGPIIIAKLLGLTMFDVDVIMGQYPANPELQMRSTLEKWIEKNGANATYGNLCAVFERAGYRDLSDRVRKICSDVSVTIKIDKETDVKHSTLDEVSKDALWKLQGVEEISETNVVVYSSQGQLVDWNGLKLCIHKDCLPEGLDQCTIYIKVSFAGEYKFPMNSFLVSAIFWLRCEPPCTFTKPITVEIQHCSTVENLSRLKIVRAYCSQKQLPYNFKPLGDGRFSANTSYGIIEVNHFSAYGVTQERPVSERKYYSRPFYRHLDHDRHEIDITFVWNTEPHINYANQQYSEKGFIAGYHKVIEIVRNVIEVVLEAAKWTEVMDGQWEIQPAQPKVTKEELDDFKTGQGIPACVLEARPLCENPPQLLHQIILLGIKPPHHELILSYRPSRIDEEQGQMSPPPLLMRPRRSKQATCADMDVGRHSTEALMRKPELHELDLLKGKSKMVTIIDSVASKWDKLATRLYFGGENIRRIQRNSQHQSDTACRNVFIDWLGGNGREPITWETLIEALKEAGLAELAKDVRDILLSG